MEFQGLGAKASLVSSLPVRSLSEGLGIGMRMRRDDSTEAHSRRLVNTGTTTTGLVCRDQNNKIPRPRCLCAQIASSSKDTSPIGSGPPSQPRCTLLPPLKAPSSIQSHSKVAGVKLQRVNGEEGRVPPMSTITMPSRPTVSPCLQEIRVWLGILS